MRHLALGVLVAVSLSCDAGTVRPIAPPGSEGAAIVAARLAQNSALRRGDLDSAATFWTRDIAVSAGLGARVRGIDELTQAFASDGRVVYERLPVEVHVSDSWPLAWESGSWAGRDRTNPDSTWILGRYAAQWVRGPSGWKIHSELFVANRCAPPACAWPVVAP